jgi:hypothetical protein
MRMKLMAKTIKTTLDEFIATMAECYGEVIREDIPEEIFEKIVERVEIARDKAVGDLGEMLRLEVVRAVDRHPAIAASKLMPSDLTAPAPTTALEPVARPVERTIPAPPPMAAPAASPLPRDVGGAEDPYLKGPPATPPPPAANMGRGDDIFDPMEEGMDHAPPAMTVEEEKRMEAGLPRKPYRPHIHHDGNTPREVPLNAALAAKKDVPPPESAEEAVPFVEETTNA